MIKSIGTTIKGFLEAELSSSISTHTIYYSFMTGSKTVPCIDIQIGETKQHEYGTQILETNVSIYVVSNARDTNAGNVHDDVLNKVTRKLDNETRLKNYFTKSSSLHVYECALEGMASTDIKEENLIASTNLYSLYWHGN